MRRDRTVVALLALLLAGCADRDELYIPDDFEIPPVPAQINTVEDVFPATGLRGHVLNRCSSCHSAACLALGQRSDERWDEIEYSHQDYIGGLSAEDRGKIFDYLKRQYPEDQPEPDIPERLLEGGCPVLED